MSPLRPLAHGQQLAGRTKAPASWKISSKPSLRMRGVESSDPGVTSRRTPGATLRPFRTPAGKMARFQYAAGYRETLVNAGAAGADEGMVHAFARDGGEVGGLVRAA